MQQICVILSVQDITRGVGGQCITMSSLGVPCVVRADCKRPIALPVMTL